MLRPIDIQNKNFDVRVRGYDRDQVDDFLDELIKDMDLLYKNNKSLQQKVISLTEEVEEFRAKESTISQSLDLTRYQCEEMKKNAQAEAENILNDAKINALSACKNIDEEHLKKQEQIQNMKKELDVYKRRIKLLCDEMLEKLDDVN